MFKIGDKVTHTISGSTGTITQLHNYGIDVTFHYPNLGESVDAFVQANELAIIVGTQAPVMVEGKMPVHSTRKQLLGMFAARKVMKADYANRNNTLSMRLAARNAHTEISSRIRCELANGARTRIVPYGWDKV